MSGQSAGRREFGSFQPFLRSGAELGYAPRLTQPSTAREPLNKNRSVIEKQEVPNKHLGYRC